MCPLAAARQFLASCCKLMFSGDRVSYRVLLASCRYYLQALVQDPVAGLVQTPSRGVLPWSNPANAKSIASTLTIIALCNSSDVVLRSLLFG